MDKVIDLSNELTHLKISNNIRMFVDKQNRKEHFSYNKFNLKYKLKINNIVSLHTEEQVIENKFLTKAQKEKILQDESLMFYEYDDKLVEQENTTGTLLCDFLNSDFNYVHLQSNRIKPISNFIDKYSITFFIGLLGLELKLQYSKKEYQELLDDIIDKYSVLLEEIKEKFIYDVEYVYNIYNSENIKDLTPLQRYYVLCNSNKSSQSLPYLDNTKIQLGMGDMYSFNFSLSGKKEKYAIEDATTNVDYILPIPYTFNSVDLKQILILEMRELVCIDKFPIKRCQNCDKFFVPDKRTDELYCNNIYLDSGKTCKDIGFFTFKKKQLQQDDVARLYKNTYQQKLLRTLRNPENQKYANDLEFFRERYKEIKEDMANGKMTKEEFKNWLIEMKKI